MFYSLPPVGEKISLVEQGLDGVLSANSTYFFSSGAASLAAAFSAVIEHAQVSQPEVILPAYTCPEVVAAILYAKAKPVLVDLEVNTTWMDLNGVESAFTENTVAIVAINFLGIPERILRLFECIGDRKIKIVEDSAQAFPRNTQNYQGDVVIHSFGRGKPVSVLGGGAVVCRDQALNTIFEKIHAELVPQKSNALMTQLKARVYNILLSPRCYWLPEALPFMKLGQTVFHPLNDIERMDDYRQSILGSNIENYQQKSLAAQQNIATMLKAFHSQEITDLAQNAGLTPDTPLLRYPILLPDHAARELLYSELSQQHLGASKLYQHTLPNIEAMPAIWAGSHFPVAETFAKRLITLPTHSNLSEKAITTIAGLIDMCLKTR